MNTTLAHGGESEGEKGLIEAGKTGVICQVRSYLGEYQGPNPYHDQEDDSDLKFTE